MDALRKIAAGALIGLLAVPASGHELAVPDRIVATAHVTVSDGTEFGAVMEYEAPLRARYSQDFSDLDMRFETDGENVRIWQNGVEAQNPPAGFASWILGHQFHAQLLRFADLNGGTVEERPYAGEGDCPCVELRGDGAHGLVVNSETRRPQRFIVHRADEEPVIARFEDWRTRHGLDLPFRVVIDDGRDVYDFRFSSIETG